MRTDQKFPLILLVLPYIFSRLELNLIFEQKYSDRKATEIYVTYAWRLKEGVAERDPLLYNQNS